jgi:protein ImuA
MADLHVLSLAVLKAKIERLENRPGLACPSRHEPERPEDLLAAAPGLLQEIFSEDRRNAGTALAFALGQARALMGARGAIVVLGLKHELHDAGFPYGAGLAHFGIDPDAVVIGIVETLPELLWALEEAVACRAVSAVVADVAGHQKALDFTASRRISLRAAESGTSVFLLRYGADREASAAHLRWRLYPAPSVPPRFDNRAVGAPRFRAVLEKGRSVREGTAFVVEWRANGFVMVDSPAKRVAASPASHGAEPAAMGDRLSKTG